MKITIFGATGALGRECLQQALAAGHNISVLVRNADQLPEETRASVQVVEGNALNLEDVKKSLPVGTAAVLFAIGVDKASPPDLCTLATKHILEVMRACTIERLVWCGGGSNLRPEDQITFGAKFVRWYANTFMNLRHVDKEHQYQLLLENTDLNWLGVRPLQMNPGPKTGTYRLGYDTFSGLSKITFADCAHAMLQMLVDDQWLGKAPIIQY